MSISRGLFRLLWPWAVETRGEKAGSVLTAVSLVVALILYGAGDPSALDTAGAGLSCPPSGCPPCECATVPDAVGESLSGDVEED